MVSTSTLMKSTAKEQHIGHTSSPTHYQLHLNQLISTSLLVVFNTTSLHPRNYVVLALVLLVQVTQLSLTKLQQREKKNGVTQTKS